MRWTDKYDIKEIIYSGLAGQAATEVLCEILDGRTNPSGKLPDSWSWDYFDIPASVNFYNRKLDEAPILADDEVWVDTCYEEGIYVGYRYFETFGRDVAYPFGHGLSYTSFTIIPAKVQSLANGDYKLEVIVKNVGSVAGREVVMIFAKLPGTHQEQPLRQLVAWVKTSELQSGESEKQIITIKRKYLTTYSSKSNAWILEQGDTELYVGFSLRHLQLAGVVTVETEQIINQLKYNMPSPVEFEEMSINGKKWPAGELSGLKQEAVKLTYARPRPWTQQIEKNRAESINSDIVTFAMVKNNPDLLDQFIAQMNIDTLARLNVMYGHGWSMDAKGEAGRIAPVIEYEVPSYVCADGNNGVNIHRPNIGMPTSVVVCATFNPELARGVGRVIGEEAAENEIDMILATALNIHRNPLNGRHADIFGGSLSGRCHGRISG
jgi:beta-glucosidase